MRCPRCSTELPANAKFCLECGLPLTSPASQEGLASPEAYTPRHLAEKILTSRPAIEGERKQVTVVFCDLANSTPLAERLGPEGMHAFLNRFFELALAEIHRYEGTVNQFLGDGFMALFGAPIAHEDDARRALMAALAMRRALRDRASYMSASEVAVRIGINTGPVVVGSIGDNLRMDYTAIGDTTNVAARLQQIAEPGMILVSEATARLVRSDVRLEPVGALSLKGKSEPVNAYRAIALAPRRSALERARERAFARFVGRAEELRELQQRLEVAVAGQGQIVGVVGEAGVGKSRLLYEFRRSLGERDLTFLEGRCRSYATAIPYLPVIDLVRGHCAIVETDTPDTIVQKVRLALLEVGIDPDERGPYLLQLLGLKEGARALDDVSPEAVKTRTLETLDQMFTESSRRRSLVVILEDLHWIDAPSEEFVRALVDGVAAAPVLFIASLRPGYEPPWRGLAAATEIVLSPLSADESASLVGSVVDHGQLSEDVLALILHKADGNPLFLEELTRAVSDHTPESPLAVPETLQGVLMARIDGLPEATKRLLQTASVLGREFSLRLLDAIWDGPGSAASHLDTLARLEFVHARSDPNEPLYAFNHALTQEVAYESLLITHRQALHEAAGAALERLYGDGLEQVYDRLAFHYSKAENAGKAIHYLERLAEKATRGYANAEAARALQEARLHAARLPDAAARDRVSVNLALEESEALFLLGRFRESLELLLGEEERVARLAEPRLTGPYYFRLGIVYGVIGEGEQATAAARRALEEATSCGDETTMGRARYLLSREAFWSGELREGVEHARQAVRLLERADDRWFLSMSHWTMGLNYALLGELDTALEEEAWAQAVGDKLGNARLVSSAAWSSGWIHAMRGEWATGIAACRRALELAPDAVSKALAVGFLGIAHLENGDAAGAGPALEQAGEAFRTFGFPQLEGWFTILRGQTALLGGKIEVARDLVHAGLAIARRSRFWPAIAAAERVLASIAESAGDPAGAQAHLEEALRLLGAASARFETAKTHLALAELAGRRPDTATASRHLTTARALFEAAHAPVYVERTERVARELGIPFVDD